MAIGDNSSLIGEQLDAPDSAPASHAPTIAAPQTPEQVAFDSLPTRPGQLSSQSERATDARLGSSTLHPEPPPPTIPGYAIEEVLGHGGMGVVYKARQIKAHRVVALKMILKSMHASVQDQVRFQIEAEAVAHLQHPNIVQFHDLGEHDGMPYFSLEFCEGGSLDRRLKSWTPTPTEAAVLIETLARAMHYAHLRGVVHRDLKPANILLAADGTPKITDFGLAKKLDSNSDITRSGMIMGTPAYMAPEQAEGKSHNTGPAADVYSLGAMLYELLAGRPPFKGDTILETIQQVMTDEPLPPSRLRAGTPRDLETICLKCLRKQPGQRYASAEHLADDLRSYRQGEVIAARAVGRFERAVKWSRRRPAVAALLLVTVFGVAGIVWKYIDAEWQKSIAQSNEQAALREADKAKKARDFLVSIFKLSDANNGRGVMTARQILEDAEKRIPLEFADQPGLQAELLAAIEEVYATLESRSIVAMILQVRGTVNWHSRGVDRPVVPQALLYAGDHLSLAADAQVQLVFLADFHKEWLKAGTDATVRRKGCEPAEAVTERVNDILLTFVRLPKGTFYMGWDGKKPGVKTELTEDFEIATHLVTQAQWQAVMGENPSYFSRLGGGSHEVKDISDEELKLFPVDYVCWDDTQEFLAKLNAQQLGLGWLYRLPTEAEWEYACRGGATTEEVCSHHFYLATPTDDLSSEQANFNGNTPYGNAPKGKFLQRTTRVGAYPPNPLGLCDMHGNLWQWCSDIFEPENMSHVYRGGGWTSLGHHCRAASRYGFRPTFRDPVHGLRLVRVREGDVSPASPGEAVVKP
jgi:formylglycine-generating enzyme required for sulfatase activity/tRNA A-37 threonylcarbamoyl transferase component Bud32